MRIRITYLATVVIAVWLLFIGNRFATDGLPDFHFMQQEVERATVQRVIERVQPGANFEAFDDFYWLDELDDFMPMMSEKLIFEAEITRGPRRGRVVRAEQFLSSFFGVTTAREVVVGDRILLVNFGDGWLFNGHLRTNKMLGLGILFVLCVLYFGRKKGFNILLSLSLTFGAIFAVFIPSILSGKNIYVMAALVCVYTTIMTLLIVIGFNKKAFTAAIGCLSGIVVTGIITLIMNSLLSLTGIVDEHSRFLLTLQTENQINLRAIIFAGITIGAMGAIMDVAISISSALWELKEKAKVIKFETLFRSGLNIGRDIFGTMANTLILAYIGTSLSVVILLGVYSNSLMELFNSEMIVVEILKALAGSFGILFAMPLTAFFCAVFYPEKNNHSA